MLIQKTMHIKTQIAIIGIGEQEAQQAILVEIVTIGPFGDFFILLIIVTKPTTDGFIIKMSLTTMQMCIIGIWP